MQEDDEYFDPEDTIEADNENINSFDLANGSDFDDEEEDLEDDDLAEKRGEDY